MRLSPNCDGQLYAGDLVVAAECELDLQTVLDAVAVWGHKLRFEFGVGSSRSALMVLPGPEGTSLLGGHTLPVVLVYKYLGVILTPTLA